MRIVAYLYSDPLLEPTPDPAIWGWEVDQVYQDLNLQAQETEKRRKVTKEPEAGRRSQFQQLLDDALVEPIAYLLVRRLEELGDSVHDVRDRLIQLENLGIKLIPIEQIPDTTQLMAGQPSNIIAAGDVRAELLKFWQQVQQSQRSRMIRQGHARNRVKALPPPGKAPFGYRRGKDKYAIDRTTAPIVKDFFDRFLLYGSLRGAVRYLEKKYNKKISASTGQRWLTNPVYRGDLAYQTGQVIPNTHAPIISREEGAQVDRLLRRNRRMPSRTASAPRSLAGLVFCGTCQSLMTVTRVTARGSDRSYLYLRPVDCPLSPKCSSVPYEQVFQASVQRICEELPQAVAGVNMPDMDRVKAGINGAIAAKHTILDQLPGLTASGILDPETAELRAYKVRSEIAELQTRLAQLPPVNLRAIAQTVSIPQFWLDLSESERRFYFREFIQQIYLTRQGNDWQLKLVFIF